MIFIPSSNPADFVCIPTEAREVFDVSGAGDTSLASLGAALAGGRHGAGGAGRVQRGRRNRGGQVRHGERDRRGVERSAGGESPQGFLLASPEQYPDGGSRCGIGGTLPEGKEGGGFTNGCFDLLHLGHRIRS